MAIAGCNCNGKLGNTGLPNVKPFGVVSGFVMVPIRANDGSRNGLDLTSLTLGQDWLDLLNNPDPSKRGYPYLDLKNVTHEEADANYEVADNGERFKTIDGIKTVSYEKWGANEQFFNKTSEACVEFGLISIDTCGNIKGQKEGDNLYPRPVNRQSFDAKFIDAVPGAGTKVMFSMDYKLITSDGAQWMLPSSNFTSVVDPLEGLGMIDVEFVDIVVDSATQITVKAEFLYGAANDRIDWTGALIGDFTMDNQTTPASITITTVVESLVTPGEYVITFPLQTTNDVVLLDAFRAATGSLLNGFEGIDNTFVAL